jgi:hypothetical protein
MAQRNSEAWGVDFQYRSSTLATITAKPTELSVTKHFRTAGGVDHHFPAFDSVAILGFSLF